MNTSQTKRTIGLCVALLLAGLSRTAVAAPGEYFAIHVVDEQSGRGIPLVELRTTFKARYYTDSNGYVAFLEPGLMGKEVWFDVKSAGYESPNGPFGMKGKAFTPAAGGSVEIKLKRHNIAERMYRMTGYGIYRDTVLLGKKTPIAEPLINSLVTGQDTVQVALFNNKYYWFWQDTDRLSFPLGNFSMTGATAPPPDKIDLDKGIEFTYFAEKPGDFVKQMTDIKQKESHPIWADGLTVVKDKAGREHMLAKYIAANKDFSANEAGLLEWNDKREVFEVLKKFDAKDELGPGGHAVRVRDGDHDYLYYASTYLTTRVKADYESASDLASYEGFTCLKPGSTNDNPDFNKDKNGKLLWTWQRGAKPAGPQQVDRWVKQKLIDRDETPFQLREADTGKPIVGHGGSVAWNPLLKKWTLLFGQQGGDTTVGELWFAVANAPEGPWRDARKVATHAKPNDNNDCYNPVMHEELFREGGRYVFFEGTFVNTFSGNPSPTPYYDYNNLMYRLDVTDPRLKLPEPPAGLSRAQPAL